VAGSANTLIGVEMPELDVWSERVAVALGMNPSLFTGPGTNTYLIGTGPRRILLDTGQGRPEYVPVLERALERCGCEGIQEIVLTHAHPDHIGGVRDVIERWGPLRVSKLRCPEEDAPWSLALEPLHDGDRVRTPGATLRAIHAPGHARDHLCFVLEEEQALFSGDNVLGRGTTVIPDQGGDLGDYLRSLERLRAERPGRIYPAHGPLVPDGVAKLHEYLAHRAERERQIVAALRAGPARIPDVVKRVYVDVPAVLHGAAAHSVAAHLRKLEREGRAQRRSEEPALDALWSLA
jgi:glyoxylase-like metal-dependent hydrolase (beta-lactamase superfamily II)